MVSTYDFCHRGVMTDAMQSIPIGNGDMGANIWADAKGLKLLLSKTDAWSELHRLLKTGLLFLELEPSPFGPETEWRLSYQEGILYIKAQDASIVIYADANAPLYHLRYTAEVARDAAFNIQNYRSREMELRADDPSNYMMMGEGLPYHCVESADRIFSRAEHSVGQYHHNDTSCYAFTLQHQALENFPLKKDPLLHRAFGFLAYSQELEVENEGLTGKSLKEFTISIVSHTGIYPDADDWVKKSYDLRQSIKTDLEAHRAYWKNVWERSWFEAAGDAESRHLTKAYIAQRYLTHCAGRGAFPIKFNGSIFTNQPSPFAEGQENYDYRRWGGPYWFQNTRLIYWSMLYCGDYELMMPLFRMYWDALPMAKYRTKVHFGHDGACYPETMSFFGVYTNINYGINREGKLPGYIANTYIRYYFAGALELCRMMLEYIDHTKDKALLKEKIFPFGKEILLFFRNHYDIKGGRLFIHPTASLETWQECVNDTPTIAGLAAVTEGFLQYDEIPVELENLCRELRVLLPDIPVAEKQGKPVVMPFEIDIERKRVNVENPELYAVFPFDRYRVGKENLSLARNTYALRDIQDSCGWQQHGIQAARLGLTAEAEKEALANSDNTNPNCIFPAFWGPNYDWLPDQDNGANLLMTLTNMLVQFDAKTIRLLPAWNKKRDVRFRLPVGSGNFVEVEFADGTLRSCKLDHPTPQHVLLDEKRIIME